MFDFDSVILITTDWHVYVIYRDVFILIAVGGEGWLSLETFEAQ